MSFDAIANDGQELGIAVGFEGVFCFYATGADLRRLEKFRFVSLGDVERTVRRASAALATASMRELNHA